MAQFARPISDITVTQFNGTFADIDEVSFSDTDFIWSNDNTTAQYECGLTNTVIDPITGSDHIISYRVTEIDGGVLGNGAGTAVSVITSLYQGGTLIASDVSRTATGAWVGYTYTLTPTEANAITDYTALRLRFDTSGGGGGANARRGIGISWAELTFPNRPPQTIDDSITLSIDNTMPLDTQMVFQSNYELTLDVLNPILVGNIFDKTISLDTNNTTSGDINIVFNQSSTLTLDNTLTDSVTLSINPIVSLDLASTVSDNNIAITNNDFILNINNTDIYTVGKEFYDTTEITGIHVLETDSVITSVYEESIILSSKIKVYIQSQGHNTVGSKSVINLGTLKNIRRII